MTTKLVGDITIENYRDMVHAGDSSGIANMIDLRFTERYLNPVSNGSHVNGFAMLAVCCLMVEALESFRRGYTDTNRKSESTFCSFFQAQPEFVELRPWAHDFYSDVR
ncbi:MAG: hypothetical protein ACMG6S_10225 [Byssovorax sp.]